MNMLLYPRPGRILATAFVFGCVGAELLAHGFHTHTPNQVIGGAVFSILALVLTFYGLRWAWRVIREFLS
jgi:hypothetical protein